jgi:hypothetical protein
MLLARMSASVTSASHTFLFGIGARKRAGLPVDRPVRRPRSDACDAKRPRRSTSPPLALPRSSPKLKILARARAAPLTLGQAGDDGGQKILVSRQSRPIGLAHFNVRRKTSMRNHLGTAHRVVGLATILLFAATGQIMDRLDLDHMAVESAARLLYRSRHIYLLFAGLVNLAVGMRFILPISGMGSRVAVLGSVLMLVAPVPLTIAFFVEPPRLGQVTLPAILGIFASYLGLLFYCVSVWRLRVRNALVPDQA